MVPDSEFSFTPQGTPLTLADLRRLRPFVASIRAAVSRHLSPLFGHPVPAAILLRQYGFLLGTAPLSGTMRAAIVAAARVVPGAYDCGMARDVLGRTGTTVCTTDAGMTTEVILARKRDLALAVEERLSSPSALYPDLHAGRLIEANTFIQDYLGRSHG